MLLTVNNLTCGLVHPDHTNYEGGKTLNTENTAQMLQKLETELMEKKAEIAALHEEIAELKQREEQHIESNQAQIEELQQLRELAQVVRKHFNDNVMVERCIACSRCEYDAMENALLKCKSFTRIRL